MICCESNIATLEYRLSPSSKWQVINLRGGKYCANLEDYPGGWAEIFTARYGFTNCQRSEGIAFFNDFDRTASYTYLNSSTEEMYRNNPCTGIIPQCSVYRNGIFLKYAHDIITLKYEFFEPTCTLKLITGNQQATTVVQVDKDKNNTCPIEYRLNCQECPKGHLKCNSSEYPGYCCLPCEPIASSIKSIKNTIQSLNKGEVSRG